MIQETFKKINEKPISNYLFELISTAKQAYMTRDKNSISLFNIKHDYIKNYFFPSPINEWSNVSFNIRNSEHLALLKKLMLTFIRPSTNRTFHCHNPNPLTPGVH